MKRLAIVVRPLEAGLLIGGRTDSRRGADDATARDAEGRLIVPATALRGALRIELERLLRGRGEPACDIAQTRDPQRETCRCGVCRLFGSEGAGTGTLRLADAVLEGDEAAPGLRPRVAIGRRTGTVAHRLLGFADTGEVDETGDARFVAEATLLPLGPGERDGAALDEDRRNLAAACRALSGLGGGRSRGLGWVSCELLEREAPPPPVAPAAAAGAVELRFVPRAPLHFGDGRPLGYFHGTLRHAPASAVRGALAFALLEQGLCTAEEPGFRDLFGAGAVARFGSARLAGDLPSETRRRCRPGEHVFDDLVRETVRRAAGERGVALVPTPDARCPVRGCVPAKVAADRDGEALDALRLGLHTRTAINRRTGTSLDTRLFSVELIEPWRTDGERVTLRCEIRELTPEAAALLARLEGREVSLGGKRSQGLGRCTVEVAAAPAAPASAARAAIDELDRALRTAWEGLDGLGGPNGRPLLPADERPVAVVLTEPWPADRNAIAAGPLDLPLRHAFVALRPVGRFGAVEARRWEAGSHVEVGEVPPEEAAAPGSTWVYFVPAAEIDRRLAGWVDAGLRGAGPLGEGRYRIRGAADPAAWKEKG